jgi:hypothetical protein
MGLKLTITIDGAKLIEPGIWKARLKPEEVTTLGSCQNKLGPFSVVMLEGEAEYNAQNQSITFDPDATRLLNVGSTDQVLVLSGNGAAATAKGKPAPRTAPVAAQAPAPPAAPSTSPTAPPEKPEVRATTAGAGPHSFSTGDKLFLSELPPDMRDMGESLLSEIRRQFPGELCYEPRAGKFDETPQIFWTIKILPQDKSLRLTVRGLPDTFSQAAGIELTPDKFGYSAFRIDRPSQVPSAVLVVRQARKNME